MPHSNVTQKRLPWLLLIPLILACNLLTNTPEPTAAPTLKPNLAAARFLRGWAAYLLDPNDPTALADVQQAANLAPKDEFYINAAAYLRP